MTNSTTIIICLVISISIIFLATASQDTPQITDPTFEEIKKFLINDTTNEHEYIYGEYMCTDFSDALFINMTTAGFIPQYVLAIAKVDNPTVNHMMVCCGNYIIEPSNDEIITINKFTQTDFGEGYHIIYLNEFHKSCLDKWWAFIENTENKSP